MGTEKELKRNECKACKKRKTGAKYKIPIFGLVAWYCNQCSGSLRKRVGLIKII